MVPRHYRGPGYGQLSTLARQQEDQRRADIAIRVLAATDSLPASKELYRRLLFAGALHVRPSEPVSAERYI